MSRQNWIRVLQEIQQLILSCFPHAGGRGAVVLALTATVVACVNCSARPHTVADRPGPPAAFWTELPGNALATFDSTKVVELAGPSGPKLFRTDIGIMFEDTVTDSAKVALFLREGMRGVKYSRTRNLFYVRIMDPGPVADSLYAVLGRLHALPEIRFAVSIPATPPRPGFR